MLFSFRLSAEEKRLKWFKTPEGAKFLRQRERNKRGMELKARRELERKARLEQGIKPAGWFLDQLSLENDRYFPEQE